MVFLGFGLVLSGCLPRGGDDLENILKNLFAEKYDKPVMDIEVDINARTDHHARGSVRLGEGAGNAGGFLASDMLGDWEIVWDGNGVYSCSQVEPYDFPPDYIEGCYDDGADKSTDGVDQDQQMKSIIKSLFLAEPGFSDLSVDDIAITFSKIATNHVSGMVEVLGGGPGNAGGFLASNIAGDWELVWHGNGVYECSLLEQYNFPENMKEGCFDNGFANEVVNEDVEQILKQRFAEKYNKNVNEVELHINDQIPSFVKGGIKFAGEISGAMFFAAEVGGEWVIVWDGNGVYECSLLQSYNFPADWMEGCI